MSFKYRTRKLIKPEDLITKYMSEMNFISAATNGEVLEIGVETAKIGRTYISVRCHVRTMQDKRDIIKIETVTFVALNAQGRPTRHALSHHVGKDPETIAVKPEGDLTHLSVAV